MFRLLNRKQRLLYARNNSANKKFKNTIKARPSAFVSVMLQSKAAATRGTFLHPLATQCCRDCETRMLHVQQGGGSATQLPGQCCRICIELNFSQHAADTGDTRLHVQPSSTSAAEQL